jgi:hypothetical protein
MTAGRLRRGSISARVNGGSTPHDTPGLAIPSITRGFTPGGHRDSSLYRTDRLMLNV